MTGPLIAIIDYDIGNLASIVNALTAIGASAISTRDQARIATADALILPGVGAFHQGMDNLRRYDLLDTIFGHISKDKPFLGICLGMQLLFEESEEFGQYEGLGIISGHVHKLKLEAGSTDKLPHIGWNTIQQPATGRWNDTIFENMPDSSDLYFVHSFAAEPKDQGAVLSTTDFGGHPFCSAVQTGAIYGCQFHPEKSGPVGLSVLRNFMSMNSTRG